MCYKALHLVASSDASANALELIKGLMDVFVKARMVTLYAMVNPLLHLMRSVKHPKKTQKAVAWVCKHGDAWAF